MTPQQMNQAFHQWSAIHYAVHGDMTKEEREITYEAVEFLINCAQVMEVKSVYPSGYPHMIDLREEHEAARN